MNNNDTINQLKKIDDQIPNPYTAGQWYDIILPDNKTGQAMRTKPGFLRIRKLTHHVVKNNQGEIIIDDGMQYSYFRANLKTGKIELL